MGAKTDNSTTKYEIRASFEIDGIVEKPDIIGGIYGQTDGLLSENLDIRELQKTGRIGRINVELRSIRGKTSGKIFIPTSLSRMETAILAATLETVDRVGPCSCTVKLDEIIDVRISKRQSIVDRASEIIRQWDQNVSPFSTNITSEVERTAKTSPVKASQVVSISDEGFSAGPGFEKQKKTILVEGRADVVNLLKYGIDNTIAVNGTSIAPKLIKLISKKTVTAFLDGDRGGDLILKELLQVSHIEYVARAPFKKEVEDLNKRETLKALDNAVPLNKAIFLTGVDEGITVKEFLEKSKPPRKKLRLGSKSRKTEPKKEKIKQQDTSVKVVKPTPTSRKTTVDKGKARTVKTKADVKVDKTPRTPAPSKSVASATSPTSSRTTTQKRPPGRPSSRPPSRSSSTRPSSRPPSRSSSTRPSSRPPSRSSGRPPGRPSGRTGTSRPPRREIRKVELSEHLSKAVKEIKTKLEAIVFDEADKEILRSSAAEIFDNLGKIEKGEVLVIDGVITQRLLERSKDKGISTVIGARKGEISKKPTNVKIVEFKHV